MIKFGIKKNNDYAHYLSYATLVSSVVHVGAMVFKLLCREIFGGFYHFLGKSLTFSKLNGIIHQKYHFMETEMAYPSHKLHR